MILQLFNFFLQLLQVLPLNLGLLRPYAGVHALKVGSSHLIIFRHILNPLEQSRLPLGLFARDSELLVGVFGGSVHVLAEVLLHLDRLRLQILFLFIVGGVVFLIFIVIILCSVLLILLLLRLILGI